MNEIKIVEGQTTGQKDLASIRIRAAVSHGKNVWGVRHEIRARLRGDRILQFDDNIALSCMERCQ